jgi:predicted ribosome quality control (RQC) complex YloA/Tae2 family protein
MKAGLSSFDVCAVVEELRELRGARLNKVYQVAPQELKVVLNIKGFGRAELVLEAGKRVHLTDYPKPSPKAPSSFAMALRKHLGNAVLQDVRQVAFDRIIEFKFSKGDKTFILVVELFGRGNIVLTREDKAILAVLHRQRFRDRELVLKEKYVYPPQKPDPFSITPEALAGLVEESKADLVRTLATRLGLGGLYAEELCHRAGVEKTKTSIDAGEAEKLLGELKNLRESIKDKKANMVFDDGKAIDVLPFPLEMYAGKEVRFYPTFNKALDEYFTKHEVERLKEAGEEEFIRELGLLEARLEEQKQALEKYREREEKYRRIGEAVYAHLSEIDETLGVLRKARKSYTWEEIIRRIEKGREKLPEARRIHKILPKEGAVILDLEGMEVRLDLGKTAPQNAEHYYSKSKKAGEKALGVEKAIAKTERLITELKEKGRKPLALEEKPRRRITRKREWYEKFRWFFSSDGFLVLGGRDATSNEVLVKRHMKTGDLFVHADIHGAPAVVIKAEGKEVPETTIKEAFDFAASYSRAWRHGLVALDVYWVKPEQVSKRAEHGEYVAKGAFIIRGKRNYGKGALELAIGVKTEEEVKVIGGPVKPISSASKHAVKIIPGRLKSKEAAEKIKTLLLGLAGDEDRAMIASLPLEEFQVFLPPGGCDVLA